MISAVIPVLDAADRLPACLGALVPGLADGVLREAVVVDGGSRDGSREIAADLGCRVIGAPRGRASQLLAGIAAARAPWLLLLHADTVLATGWTDACRAHLECEAGAGMARDRARAGFFRLAFDRDGAWPRTVARGANWRARTFGLPYGDQGLLIHRETLQAVGGVRLLPFLEDVDLVRRLGWGGLRPLDAVAVTSASRYLRDGWMRRTCVNSLIVLAFLAGIPARTLAGLYR